jgi:hypothetical protein
MRGRARAWFGEGAEGFTPQLSKPTPKAGCSERERESESESRAAACMQRLLVTLILRLNSLRRAGKCERAVSPGEPVREGASAVSASTQQRGTAM